MWKPLKVLIFFAALFPGVIVADPKPCAFETRWLAGRTDLVNAIRARLKLFKENPRSPPETVRRQEEVLVQREKELANAKETLGRCQDQAHMTEEAAKRRRAEEEAQWDATTKAQLANQARQARFEARKADPRALPIALSAQICWYQKDRQESLEAIAKENKYGRISGVVDRKALYDWGQDIRRADEKIPPLLAQLRTLKTKPMPCGGGQIPAIVACLDGPLGQILGAPPDHCEQAPVDEYLAMVDDDE